MSSPNTFSRRQFLGTLAAGGAATVSGLRSPELEAQTGKQSLAPSDFNYLGCFKLPAFPFSPNQALLNANQNNRLTYTTYAYHQAPLAMRIVNGERRFFVVGHVNGNNAVTEVTLPSLLSPTVVGAPTAQTVDYWGTSIYGSPVKKMSASFPGGSTQLLTHGLFWDEVRQVLWWSFGDVFDTIGRGPTIGYARLGPSTGSPTSLPTATAYGPFDLNSGQNWTQNLKGGIMELPPSFRTHVGNRRLAVGGMFTSIQGPNDFGPSLIAFDEPLDTSIPTALGAYPFGPSNRFIASTRDILRYGNGTPNNVDSHGNYAYLSRCRRPTDYSVMNLSPTSVPPAAGAGGTTVNPYQGKGWWTHLDIVSGSAWIETVNKAGIVFSGGMASGRSWYTLDGYSQPAGMPPVQIPNDPRGISGWYGNPPTWDGGRIGSEYFNPGFYIFSVQDLINGATKGYGNYQQDPVAWRHTVGDPVAAVAYGAPVFDPATRRLYVIQVNAYPFGLERASVVHCWEIMDSNASLPSPRAPGNPVVR